MRPRAAAPKITRLLWWPVRPKGARSIMRPTLRRVVPPPRGGGPAPSTPPAPEGLDEPVVTWHGRRWRAAIGAVLVIGLLGGVALAALAGARRTASGYAEYLRASNASDVFVNTPLPGLERP